MERLVHVFDEPVLDADGHLYEARVLGREREDGTWVGWLEFSPHGSGGVVRCTERETTQPTLGALAYWASGIEPVYLEGAIARAQRSSRMSTSRST